MMLCTENQQIASYMQGCVDLDVLHPLTLETLAMQSVLASYYFHVSGLHVASSLEVVWPYCIVITTPTFAYSLVQVPHKYRPYLPYRLLQASECMIMHDLCSDL